MRQLTLGVRLKERATFASFVGGQNGEVVAHLRALVEKPAAGATWIMGPRASGKSHLLQAQCAATLLPRRAVYLPIAILSSLGTGALDGAEAFDCLCVDDVDAAAGNTDWERALFGLWHRSLERGAVMTFSASAAPAAVGFTLPDLVSRFASAPVFALRELDDDGQYEALRLRAQLRGLELPLETARYLQRRFPRDMRSLCGILDALDDASFVEQRRLTVPFIRDVIERAK